jgi:hypothetical protein
MSDHEQDTTAYEPTEAEVQAAVRALRETQRELMGLPRQPTATETLSNKGRYELPILARAALIAARKVSQP